MGWKRERFKRRVRELSAEWAGDGRVYPPLDDIERSSAYNWDYKWQCLLRAWKAGRAVGKSPLTLQHEAEEWLAKIGINRPHVVSRAFIDAIMGCREWQNKCDMSRFEVANKTLNRSEPGMGPRQAEEFQDWYSDIVMECANIYKTSAPDANYAIAGWAETRGILPRLWGLYERGPKTMEDRDALKTLLTEILGVDERQADAWISAQEARE